MNPGPLAACCPKARPRPARGPSARGVPASNELEAKTPLTFTLPLKEALEASKVHFVTKGRKSPKKTAPAECAGSVEAPSAKAGSLCVYEGSGSKVFQGLAGGSLSVVIVKASQKGRGREHCRRGALHHRGRRWCGHSDQRLRHLCGDGARSVVHPQPNPGGHRPPGGWGTNTVHDTTQPKGRSSRR